VHAYSLSGGVDGQSPRTLQVPVDDDRKCAVLARHHDVAKRCVRPIYVPDVRVNSDRCQKQKNGQFRKGGGMRLFNDALGHLLIRRRGIHIVSFC